VPERTVLVVDGANVVGSRPDGWWRDRAGAARRLHGRLAVADLDPYDDVVLVLEGAARGGVPAGDDGPLRTVHAARDGDTALVEAVRDVVDAGGRAAVVTADRGLQLRVEALGASVRSPSWLLDALEA